MTMAPAAAAIGAYLADTAPPGENRATSTLEKSKWARSSIFRILSSPKLTSWPTERLEATAWTRSTGNWRSLRIERISRPTLPDAPTTATV